MKSYIRATLGMAGFSDARPASVSSSGRLCVTSGPFAAILSHLGAAYPVAGLSGAPALARYGSVLKLASRESGEYALAEELILRLEPLYLGARRSRDSDAIGHDLVLAELLASQIDLQSPRHAIPPVEVDPLAVNVHLPAH